MRPAWADDLFKTAAGLVAERQQAEYAQQAAMQPNPYIHDFGRGTGSCWTDQEFEAYDKSPIRREAEAGTVIEGKVLP